MTDPYLADIADIQRIPEVEAILAELCECTGMGFAAVARVTSDRWIACQVLDKIEFGLNPGDELVVKTTICDEIRDSGQGVFINDVDADPAWRTHHTPALYGLKSYISWPIVRADGSFFGTLCAIDPASRSGLAALVPQMEIYAALIAAELDRLSLAASR
ncbi:MULTISPECIES: GAF domain-containing protein [unclassified Sphingomonas]|uniref:GAF domain-containing protein n=1 Tax=unclassified Sphingomonas TaxID=196159 RepID=UPI0022B42A16|nr:GAF domain-containing protein [Sphingomonas sp. NIBR02145]WHU01060.1 GAF domain-containing protein [Sphingomonas sp. NIBR02145]